MKFCTKCGERLQVGQSFCTHCGAKVEEPILASNNNSKNTKITTNSSKAVEGRRKSFFFGKNLMCLAIALLVVSCAYFAVSRIWSTVTPGAFESKTSKLYYHSDSGQKYELVEEKSIKWPMDLKGIHHSSSGAVLADSMNIYNFRRKYVKDYGYYTKPLKIVLTKPTEAFDSVEKDKKNLGQLTPKTTAEIMDYKKLASGEWVYLANIKTPENASLQKGWIRCDGFEYSTEKKDRNLWLLEDQPWYDKDRNPKEPGRWRYLGTQKGWFEYFTDNYGTVDFYIDVNSIRMTADNIFFTSLEISKNKYTTYSAKVTSIGTKPTNYVYGTKYHRIMPKEEYEKLQKEHKDKSPFEVNSSQEKVARDRETGVFIHTTNGELCGSIENEKLIYDGFIKILEGK